MNQVEGTIEEIVKFENVFNTKCLVTIRQTEKLVCFVEFRGNIMMNILAPYNVGEKVTVCFNIEGKKSQQSGIHYNNLVAVNIKTLSTNN